MQPARSWWWIWNAASLCTFILKSEIVNVWWCNLNPRVGDAIKFKLCVDYRISTCTCIIINVQVELTASWKYRCIGRCCHGSRVIPRALLSSNWPSILRHRKLLSRFVSYPSRPLTVKVTENCWAQGSVVTGFDLSLAPSYSQIYWVLLGWRVIPRDLVLSN